MSDHRLLERFVAAFEKLDDLTVWGDDQLIPAELDAGTDDSQRANRKWKPAAVETERAALTAIYEHLPASFPPLYEDLILSYRWLDVELDGFASLFANASGPAFSGLFSRMTAVRAFVEVLFPLGLIPFGHGTGDNYDPVCFATARRHRRHGDCPIVQVEHESVLCNLRIGKSWEIAESFRSFVEGVLEKAENLGQ